MRNNSPQARCCLLCWFWTLATREASRAQLVGVQKAPRHEVAGKTMNDETNGMRRANCDGAGTDGARRTSAFLSETDLVAIGPHLTSSVSATMSAFGPCSAGREDDTHLQPGWHRLMTDGLPGKPEAVRGPPDSNLPCREISRYGGREIPARATFDAQLVNKQLTETRHDAEIGQDSRRVCDGPHARRRHSHEGRSSRPPYSPCSSHPPCSRRLRGRLLPSLCSAASAAVLPSLRSASTTVLPSLCSAASSAVLCLWRWLR